MVMHAHGVKPAICKQWKMASNVVPLPLGIKSGDILDSRLMKRVQYLTRKRCSVINVIKSYRALEIQQI